MDIIGIIGREILDSRGNPTVEAEILLEDGSSARASVPSGASTGSLEACELRDQDPHRFNGKGVLKAVSAINDEISDSIIGLNAVEQVNIDNILIELDGTPNKSRLGANAILAVSMAIAKAAANSYAMPLYQYLGGVFSHQMPVPLMNILNGGMHADNGIDIQEFMICPLEAPNFREALRMGTEVFYALKATLKAAGYNTNTGDEGGFAPEINSSEEALDFVLKAIEDAGYKPGKDIAIALDAAASEFYHDGTYKFIGTGQEFTSDKLIVFYENLVNNYPIISIEDAMSEHDRAGWVAITKVLGNKVQLVGDDLFVTNSAILEKAAKENIANSILIKPNQIGTITETLRTVETAHKLGYTAILSHRSGETEDTTIAHLAVATNCGQIKTGSASRADRTAKYNELLRIEENLNGASSFHGAGVFKYRK